MISNAIGTLTLLKRPKKRQQRLKIQMHYATTAPRVKCTRDTKAIFPGPWRRLAGERARGVPARARLRQRAVTLRPEGLTVAAAQA